jgi:hypothetical protein
LNSIFNDFTKKRVVSTLFLYLLIFSLGCDFKSPQKWETPSWYLPLTIPLINKVYSFEGIVDSSIIFADSLTNVTQIVFGDSIPESGIPDSIFNIDMSTAGLDAPDIGMADIAIEVAGNIDIEIPTIEAPNPVFALLTTKGSCFPQSQVGELQSALDTIEPDELDMPISFETNESISIKEVIVNEGKWRMAVTNDWAVPISFSFKLVNGETVDSVLYNPVFSKIPPYTTPLPNEEPITTSNTTILDVTDIFNYSIIISILNEDTNCTGYECSLTSLGYDSESECLTNCPGGSCDSYVGWTVDPAITENLTIEFSAEFDKIGSVVADVNIEAPSTDPITIGIPSMQGISITRAKLAEFTSEYPNQFQLEISNGFIADLNMTMYFNNIFNHAIYEGVDYLTDPLIVPMIIEPGNTLNEIIDISDKFLAYGVDSEQPVDSIEIAYEVDIASGEYTIDVVNDSIKIGMPSINSIEVTDLRLEYIAAVTEELGFPDMPSPPIEGIPDGFSGFEFYDTFMNFEFFNEIGVPVGLNMEFLGSNADGTETIAVDLNIEVGAPYKDNYGCTFNSTGDTARTVIKINKDFQTTEYYCSPDAPEPSHTIRETFSSDGSDNTGMVDLMNFAPENINVGGDVIINGKGILAPNSQIWGTFSLIVPLAFIFEQPINIIPAEPTAMEPMEPSTAQQIDSALVEVALNVTVGNNSPLGGSLSLLISDSTIFPLFLDSLTTGSWENQIYNFNTAIWDTLEPPMVIDSISFTAIDPSSDTLKALEVKFFNDDNLQFFIGRMFELEFPRADSIEYHLGYVNPEFPNIHNSDMVIDTVRMDWVITDEPRYNIAMMTFDSSPIQSITDTDTEYIPLTFQTTNTIEVQAYFTLILDTGGLGRDSSSNDK